MSPDASDPLPGAEVGRRRFGHFELLGLLGRSRRTMAWRARALPAGQPVLLVLPRIAPKGAAALAAWREAVRQAARVSHPELLSPAEVGVHQGWPFLVYQDPGLPTLAQRMEEAVAPREAAHAVARAALGLAYAHEAGVAHGDLQAWLILCGDSGKVLLFGLEAGFAELVPGGAGTEATALDGAHLQARRALFRRDIVSLGVVLHHALSGRPPLDEADATEVALRLPPEGRDTVRLPWLPERPVPGLLRQFVDRATDRQPLQRFQSARTALQSLEEWLDEESVFGDQVLRVLGERILAAGLLPSAAGFAQRVSRLAAMDGRRTQELAAVVLEDPALTFEILRLVNAAQDRAPPVLGSGPVLTVRRGIAMLGVQRLRRAAQGLRPWPGALVSADAARLEQLMERCRHAGRLAQALRPAGYDEESVYLVVLFQNLSRLALASHFPAEYLQLDALCTGQEPTGDETRPGRPSENSACLAVLGVELEAVASSIARPWALGEGMARLMRRIPSDAPVHPGAQEDEVLRATASCANDAVDALRLPVKERDRALAQIVMHYGAALSLTEAALRRSLVETAGLGAPRQGSGGRA